MTKVARYAFAPLCVMCAWGKAEPGFGWGPIAHYEMTKRALSEGDPPPMFGWEARQVAKFANVPDYVDSWVLLGEDWLPDVTDYFCWSHGVQDEGKEGLVCRKPTYPDDGRYPGPVMWNLLERKLTDLEPDETAVMRWTCKGFRCHNAADRGTKGREVHFEYFSGGTFDAWLYEHSYKESWADLRVYIRAKFGGNPDRAFDANGSLKMGFMLVGEDDWVPDEEYANGVPVFGTGPSDDLVRMAIIMQQGQKAYRKNRRGMDKGHLGKLEVQPVATIVQEYTDKVLDGCSKSSITAYYTWSKWDELVGIATVRGWQLEDVWNRYADAVVEAQQWLSALASQEQ